MQRKTTQHLAPFQHQPTESGQYDVYPAFGLGDGKISVGFEALAQHLASYSRVVIDGYVGVFWDEFREKLTAAFAEHNITSSWSDVADAMLPEAEINAVVEPFLGGDDPIFGTRFTGTLADFFETDKLSAIQPSADAQLSIVYGCGAALANWDDALLVYLDVPKNEIQFRSRAASFTNLGASQPEHPKKMYKRFYFVDWIALNAHKAELLSSIDVMVDAQRPDTPTMVSGDDLRAGLTKMSQSYFRVRPWFEPGAWGGQWIKERMPQLAQDVPNYAWSFELIVPENGLMFESDNNLLEVSFDCLMYHDNYAVIGQSADRFGYEFPIRFDFLDTFDGGNLSLQCHPRPEFIAQHFGETFTQDETYYILDCEPDADVYLGFQQGIDPNEFRRVLEHSQAEGVEVDVEQFVQIHKAKKHDLFLIPNGTVHCSGINNMVLEISATPYIFTFKMYDWLRLDLDGKPRPINIERAFENLRFEMQGDVVTNDLISKPYELASGDGWKLIHVPTHARHFYDVHRYDIEAGASVAINTNGSVHIMSLVEGTTVVLTPAETESVQFNYAETFVVPAAAQTYKLTNNTDEPIKVICSFMKEA